MCLFMIVYICKTIIHSHLIFVVLCDPCIACIIFIFTLEPTLTLAYCFVRPRITCAAGKKVKHVADYKGDVTGGNVSEKDFNKLLF